MAKSYSGLKALNERLIEELDIMFKMYLLLYADDTIIMSESAGDLQTALNALHDYCQKWSLKVNIDKTKIIIFSRGRVKKHQIFTLGNREVMVEEEYKYLGVVFNYNGSFKKAIGQQIIQSRKAMFGLLERAKKLPLPIDITCELFDRVVTPILLYGCEVWGMSDIRDVEIFHRSFLRIMLKTFKFTPNCMLFGETGTTDLYTVVKNRMINFWVKLKFGDQNKLSSIMLRLLDKLQLEQPEKFSFKWITQIKSILVNTGFSEVWTADSIDSDLFKIAFKQRCDDIFKQTWLTDMMNNSQCTEYRKMKERHEFENHLIELEPSDRIALFKFRTRTHHLPVTHTRFQAPGGCFTNFSRALQNILSKFVCCRNRTSYDHFKLRLCSCAQSRALGTRTKFQLEILTRNVITGILYFREIILESSRNVSETTPRSKSYQLPTVPIKRSWGWITLLT